MPQKSRTRKSALAVLFAALGITVAIASSTAAVFIVSSTPVFAADDDDDEWWDVKMVRKFLRGFGLRNGQEAGIEYKERPPLVLPRGSDLPAPVAANSPAAANPAWPSDPDEKRRADQRRARKDGGGHRLDRMDTSAGGADGNPLRPSELDAGRTDRPGVKTGNQEPEPARGGRAELTPDQLGWTNSMWSGMVGLSNSFTGAKTVETGTFVREPSRNTLTDPPSGYRTPSPDQPYGINSKADRPSAKVRDHQATQ